MPALVVMIAPPGAGKSTWVAQRFLPTQIVNLDTYRALVADDPHDQSATRDAVDVQEKIVAARCSRRLLTVVDATNAHVGYRAGLIEHAHRNLMLPVAVVLDVPLGDCLIQNRRRPRPVPDDAVHRIFDQISKTVPAEGPVEGFEMTRRIGPCWDVVYGDLPPQFLGAPWLR